MNPKNLILAFILSSAGADAASVFWSFQTDATGVTDSFQSPSSSGYTSNNGFGGTPILAPIQGSGSASISGSVGGTTFTDPFTSTTYVGSGTGGGGSTGNSLVWGTSNSTNQHLTGAGFRLGSLDMTGLTDLVIRFDIRAATSASTTGVPTQFATMEYRIDGGTWTSTGLTSPTWAVGTSWQSNITLDLSSLDAIEGQSNVELRFIFNGTTKTAADYQNVRLDNLLLTAVPEPSAALLAAGGLLGFVLRRRR